MTANPADAAWILQRRFVGQAERVCLAAMIAALTLIRLLVAATAPLAPDETYYWVWSRALAFGYLDHPPMVALWIRAGTLLAGQTALGVRLIGPVAAALGAWMVFDAARRLFPGSKAGAAAVLLLNASLLVGVGSVIMTPDSPLLFFWTATLWAMARIATGGPGVWWLAGGLFAGLALDSKYTALFLWAGVGLWVVLVPTVRPWLRRWQPWAACVIGLGLFTPVLAWNATREWAGFARQGGRVGDWRPGRALNFLAELVGSQVGLATPLIWGLCMAGLVAATRRACRTRDPGCSLLAALSLPPLLVFVQHAVGDRVQGNWPAIIYPALCVAAGGLAIRPRWWLGAAGLGFAVTALAYLQATTGLLPLPPKLDPIALRLTGWGGLADQLRTPELYGGAKFIAADGYGLASELAWWLPGDIPAIGTDRRWRLTTLPPASIIGQQGLLVRDAGRREPPDPVLWSEPRRVGTLRRPGGAGTEYPVYQITAAAGAPIVAALPHR